jgi:hypothetical protein
MLITTTTAVTLSVFVVLIAISSALMFSLGSVLTTLIEPGSVDKYTVPKGLFNLRCLSALNPVSLYPVSYSLLELSLESLLHFLRFLDLPVFLQAFA